MKYKKSPLFSSKVFIVLCLVFILYCTFCWCKIATKTKKSQNWIKEQYNLCEKYSSLSSKDERELFISKNKKFNINDTSCEKISTSKVLPYSTYNVYYNFFYRELLLVYNMYTDFSTFSISLFNIKRI